MPRLLKIAGSLLVAAQMIGLSGAAFAQSASLDDILANAGEVHSPTSFATIEQRLLGAGLSYSQILPKALFVNENLYVYLLQTRLIAQGKDVSANGLLTKQTIIALMDFCSRNGLSNECNLGPMTAGAAAGIGAVLDGMGMPTPATKTADTTAATAAPADTAPSDTSITTLPPADSAAADTTTETSPPAQTAPIAGTVVTGTLPAGWSIPFTPESGITVTVSEAAPDTAVIHFAGTATADRFINVIFGDAVTTTAGEAWTASISASDVTNASSGDVKLMLLAQVRDGANKYIGELVRGGASLLTNVPSSTLSGTVPAEGASVQPYVQLAYKTGSTVDVTVRLTTPTLTQD